MEEIVQGLLPRAGGDDGYARGKRALVVTTVLTALATVIVAMRLFARLRLMKITGREDWTILGSLVSWASKTPASKLMTDSLSCSQIFSIVYLSLVAARMSPTKPSDSLPGIDISSRIPLWHGHPLDTTLRP